MSYFESIGEKGMNAPFEYMANYGTITAIEYVMLDIKDCCEELGYMKEAKEISDLMMTLWFPKVPLAIKRAIICG